MRTSFHHQPEAQHPHSPAINTPAGRLPHLLERGDRFAREPGIVVRRIAATEDHLHSVFEIVLWQQMKMYSSVTK